MKEIFKEIPTKITIPTLEYFKRKHKTILIDNGGDWFINTISNHISTMKKQRLSKKQ